MSRGWTHARKRSVPALPLDLENRTKRGALTTGRSARVTMSRRSEAGHLRERRFSFRIAWKRALTRKFLRRLLRQEVSLRRREHRSGRE
jgi:hypothetical protein